MASMAFFNKLKNIAFEITLFFSLHRKKYIDKMRESLLKLKEGLSQEKEETKEMLEIYQRFTQGECTKEEMQIANAQFRDLIKSLGLGVILVLPFAPITIPVVVKIGKKLGIDVLPSAFNDKD